MNIIITTYFFYPQSLPRAFRSFELAKEFSRQGHKVTVCIPGNDYDYKHIEEKYGFSVKKTKTQSFLSKMFVIKKSRILLDSIINYSIPLSSALKKDRKKYDLLISVGLPFSVHLGCYLAQIMNKKIAGTRVADYGDPFSLDTKSQRKQSWKLKVFRKLEGLVLKKFDFITAPTEKAATLYVAFKEKNRIKTIPQGFDFSNIQIADYSPNNICTFAYAGRFYENIRDPKLLFKILSEVKKEFRFIIYTRVNEKSNMQLIEGYKKALKNKLIIRDLVEREKLIFDLSKCDFLINMFNETDYQTPSKIIDYALTKRPVFHCSQNNIDQSKLVALINGSFEKDSSSFDLKPFDIKNVSKSFLSLVKH